MPALNSFSQISSDSTADSDLIFLHDVSATQSNATRSMPFSTITERALGSALVTFGATNEKMTQIENATGTVTHDTSLSTVFHHKNITDNFQPDFTNVPLTNDRALSPAIILNQGASAYMVNGVFINGDSQTVNWLGGSVPSGTANGVDIVGISLIRDSDTWTVIASNNGYS